MIDPIQNHAIYPVLQHYLGCKIASIFPKGEDIMFRTLMGERGILFEDLSGDWKIRIEGEIVYTIEGSVFNVLVNPSKKNSLEDYVQILNDLLSSKSISYRSRILVTNILAFLEEYILSSDFLPKRNLKIGPFEISNCNNIKFINCLN